MANSPSIAKDRVLSCSVYCNGTKLKDNYALVSATVRLELNRIGKATLRFNAGNMDKQTFDESDVDLLKPGNSIRLNAGDTEKKIPCSKVLSPACVSSSARIFVHIWWWNAETMPILPRRDARTVSSKKSGQ